MSIGKSWDNITPMSSKEDMQENKEQIEKWPSWTRSSTSLLHEMQLPNREGKIIPLTHKEQHTEKTEKISFLYPKGSKIATFYNMFKNTSEI